ncbi:MAG: alpha-glucosidase/alpha-galactosidase [Sediminispirochaetaceae bacterium]
MILTFLGAGSTVFVRNILGDVFLTPALRDAEVRLYDIDDRRLQASVDIVGMLNENMNNGAADIRAYCGEPRRGEALRGSDFVINAIQVGGYEPATVIDFELPAKYDLRQTIGDTLGIGGIFRGIRTLQVMFEIVREMEEECPDALLLNYVNPLSIVTGGILRYSQIRTVGLCHSVQVCVPRLLEYAGIELNPEEVRWKIAGINHMAWLLEITHDGRDLYPEIKRQTLAMRDHPDRVRFELMKRFGYYVTESSEHNAEYTPYWIKRTHPELIEEYHIPLDEYPRRCRQQIEEWERNRDEVLQGRSPGSGNQQSKRDPKEPSMSYEYAALIMDSMATGRVRRVHGNVLNTGLIQNLPDEAVVEVPCLVDRNGVQGVFAGRLPIQCAALNSAAVHVQLMTIEAAVSGSREALYQAAFLDPHTASELTIDEIVALCDEMLAAHGDYCRIIR